MKRAKKSYVRKAAVEFAKAVSDDIEGLHFAQRILAKELFRGRKSTNARIAGIERRLPRVGRQGRNQTTER